MKKKLHNAVFFDEISSTVEGIAIALLGTQFQKKRGDSNIYIIGDRQDYIHYHGWGFLPAKSVTTGEDFYFYAEAFDVALTEKSDCPRLLNYEAWTSTKREMAIKLAMLQYVAKDQRSGRLGPKWITVVSEEEAIDSGGWKAYVGAFLSELSLRRLGARWYALRNWRKYYLALWNEKYRFNPLEDFQYMMGDIRKMLDDPTTLMSSFFTLTDNYRRASEQTKG